MPEKIGLERAGDAVAVRFTRTMKATTSAWGVLTDPPVVALASGIGLLLTLGVSRLGAPEIVVRVVAGLIALPIVLSVVCWLSLRRARADLVAWMSRLPFALENMNAVLNGLGETLDIQFAGDGPATKAMNEALDRVHGDCFVTKGMDEGDPKRMEIRIGVVDSKRNPAVSNHQRFARVMTLCEAVLVPLTEEHPIVEVRVK